MSIQKVFHRNKPICNVTFKLNKEMANSAIQANLVGDFNNWDKNKIQMKKDRNGGFLISIDLDIENEYEFKYLLDNNEWINESEADKQVSNEFQGTNSVITV